MTATDDLARIQTSVRNALPPALAGGTRLAGILGEAPSRYSRSPSLWNGAFRSLDWDAVYLPFDVDESGLPGFMKALRSSPRLMGINVTVPYKVRVIPYLDRLEGNAARLQAVNTVVRTREGQLIGLNTDGAGFLESIQKPLPGQERPLVPSFKGVSVLILGSGGSARAVAFSLAEVLDGGDLWICNRTEGPAVSLARDLGPGFSRVRALKEEELSLWAPRAGLIVNCSTKGQGEILRMGEGKVTVLEPYSALAPAHPAVIEESQAEAPAIYHAWLQASLPDVEANNGASWKTMLSIPLETRFYDLIYFPEETVFLRHARLSGHSALNGLGMLVCQAVEAFLAISRNDLERRGLDPEETRRRVIGSMWAVERFPTQR